MAEELIVDPEAKLEEELIVRPTSETIIWNTYKDWIQSYRDLPIAHQPMGQCGTMGNAYTIISAYSRIFMAGRTYCTCYRRRSDRRNRTNAECICRFCRRMDGDAGDKRSKNRNERFAGAEDTYCIEALMQDGKALQAGTSHFLGQNFAKAFDVKFSE